MLGILGFMAEKQKDSNVPKKKKTLEEQKAELEAKHAQKMAAIDLKLKAKKSRESKAERSKETRRKIITGALARKHMKANPKSDFALKMDALLKEYTIADHDRALFGFPLLSKKDQDKRRATHKKEQNTKSEESF